MHDWSNNDNSQLHIFQVHRLKKIRKPSPNSNRECHGPYIWPCFLHSLVHYLCRKKGLFFGHTITYSLLFPWRVSYHFALKNLNPTNRYKDSLLMPDFRWNLITSFNVQSYYRVAPCGTQCKYLIHHKISFDNCTIFLVMSWKLYVKCVFISPISLIFY